ncbi:MAG: DUF3696 domain-containing protein [Chloroflexota bacterium]|nr:DUF3696 domain-containing protein [Chloroflexota bacterium]
MSADQSADEKRDDAAKGITEIAVQGFKSLYDEQRIKVRPLTILAGANNSGKSSIMQPLLMLKQTLDATYDPGPLKLDGPNVHFTSAEQFLSRRRSDGGIPIHLDGAKFTVRLAVRDDEMQGEEWMASTFEYQQGRGVDLFEIRTSRWPRFSLRPEEAPLADDPDDDMNESLVRAFPGILGEEQMIGDVKMLRKRCFLSVEVHSEDSFAREYLLFSPFAHYVVILFVHVPALRGNPRTYQSAGFDLQHRFHYEGTFENYIASIIESWQNTQDGRLERLGRALKKLNLTWKVVAGRLNDVEIELRAARLSKRQVNEREDLVNIADMGVGVSQVLPVLVALLTAVPGQLVYLEHPERDLHPRAQVALAQVLADAAKRGVRVVVETHSPLLLLGVQTLIAEGTLPPDHVALHWFERSEDGATTVTSADLDEAGAFGDWPEDFADVDLKSDSRYLDAAESVLWKQARAS